MPYDPHLSVSAQLHASIKSSLHNLRTSDESDESSYLDSLVLHSPLLTMAETMEVWRAAETYVPHRIRHLGISNVSADTLEHLYGAAKVKPTIVQNRFHNQTQFDVRIRRFCTERSIFYQSFWTLSANPQIVHSAVASAVGNQIGMSYHQAVYCLVLSLENVMILNGTKSEAHMVGDLESLKKAREWASKHPDSWAQHTEDFRALIGESE